MSNEAADYLLEKHGIISLPHDIDHEAYEMVLYRLTQGRMLHPDMPLRLFCHGNGGFTYDALAMVDLIRADGNVDGMLTGSAASMSAVVWAACARRFVYPNGRIGIHPVSSGHSDGDRRIFHAEMEELEALDNRICQIFGDASSERGSVWWHSRLYEDGDLKWLLADELMGIGMAKPVSERTS
jgi:ATP-dependent protease ClpP protease subunit